MGNLKIKNINYTKELNRNSKTKKWNTWKKKKGYMDLTADWRMKNREMNLKTDQ